MQLSNNLFIDQKRLEIEDPLETSNLQAPIRSSIFTCQAAASRFHQLVTLPRAASNRKKPHGFKVWGASGLGHLARTRRSRIRVQGFGLTILLLSAGPVYVYITGL